MSYDMRVLASAKINIGLRVLPLREDGYHGIESVFQLVPLYDILQIRRTGSMGRSCIVDCDGMILPDDNTLVLAYNAFCDVTGVSVPVYVRLEKHIPAGAGLGGGSSDAAAFVCAMGRLCGVCLPPEYRTQIASLVGSDVFFFLSPEVEQLGCAVVTGRGEVVDAFRKRQDLFFVVICPEIHSSTREAYQLVDERHVYGVSWNGPDVASLVSEYNRPVREWTFVNSFTEPLVERYPLIACALQDLRGVGADFVQMSGSGSAVFGVFGSAAQANNATSLLRKKWKRCFSFASS